MNDQKPKTCARKGCNKEFKPAKKHQLYCCDSCRYKAWFNRTYMKRSA